MTINNNNIFGAFTLNEARGSRLTGDWLHTDTIANYGWFGGGAPAPSVIDATIDRIDFSNDTVSASARSLLSQARTKLAATGNSNYGWFGGGRAASTNYSTVDRTDFSNDSATASVRGPLSAIKGYLTATGNSNYGWFGGGGGFPGPLSSSVDRMDFSNDSNVLSPRGSLSLARIQLAATGNSNYGWFGGGGTFPLSPVYSTVDRIDFSNDFSIASPRGPLSSARYGPAATGNSNYGWFGGGTLSNTGPTVSTIDRIDFSNDSSTASVRGPLSPSAKFVLAATGNSNYGWFGGGGTFPPFASSGTVNRIDFSNDSISASPRGALSAARYNLAATSGVLNIRRQKAGNYGWFGGGLIPGPDTSSTVNRIDFSNDSVSASPRGLLSLDREALAATGNSNYGWFGGGYSVVMRSRVDRIDFSNDSSSASVRGPLSQARNSLSATGNSNYGWFSGSGPASINLDRIDFSNDSGEPRLRTGFNAPYIFDNAATGNSNYGWFGGGRGGSPIATVATANRIDFSNDSGTASPRGSLSAARYGLAATGNSNYGWFGGGNGPVATVDRIDFSNDSVSASVRGPLSQARNNLAATGNSNYGWFGGGRGGSPTAPVATVDRIDFSNDSVSASLRGSLSITKSKLRATSNTSR